MAEGFGIWYSLRCHLSKQFQSYLMVSADLDMGFSILMNSMIFSRRFMKWNATIIVAFFNPHELTKIVLQNFKRPNCTIWPRELNYDRRD